MSAKINKNGKEYNLGFMPQHYPADRVYLDGDTSKTVQNAVDKSQVMIATVQPNLTAVKAYAKDEQFVYNGLLYKATAAISSGGTITIGGNCDLSDSVTEQISNKKPLQEAVADPTANGYSVSFISSIAQNAEGVISATKKNVAFRDYLSSNSQKSITIGNSKCYMLIAIGYTGCVVIGRTTIDGSHNIYTVYNSNTNPITVGTNTKGVITVLNPTDGTLFVYIMYLP